LERACIQKKHWAFLFGLAALAAIYHGIKEDDGMTREFGIIFLCISRLSVVGEIHVQ